MADFTPRDFDDNAFFELSAEPMCVLDSAGTFLYINAAWTEVFGVSPCEPETRPLLHWIHEDDCDEVKRHFSQLLSTDAGQSDQSVEFSCRIRCRPPGAQKEVFRMSAWSAVRAKDSPHIAAWAEDIHDEFSALRLFGMLLERVPDFVAISRLNGELLYLNPAGLALVGLSSGQIQNMRHRDLIPEWEMMRLNQDVLPQLQRIGMWTGDSFFQHSNGSILPVHRTIVALRNERETPIGYGSIASDLRALEQEEGELRRLYALLEHTSDLVTIAGLDESFQYLNAAGRAMLGAHGHSIRDLKLLDVLPPLRSETLPDDFEDDPLCLGILNLEDELHTPDGRSIPASITVTLLRDEHGAPDALGIVARDLSERKALEESLKRSIQSLSAPILEVGEGILALPIVGAVDQERAHHMRDSLLDSIASRRAHTVVLDLTGALVPDAASKHELIGMIHHMTRGAALLGARCLLSGFSPELACEAVREDSNTIKMADHSEQLPAFRTLSLALKYAMRRDGPRA